MAVEQFTNNAQTTLNGSITNSQTTITVTSNTGFPTAAQFRIIIDSEIMLVTAGQGGLTWTVTRGNNLSAPDTTVNAAHNTLATVTHVLTAGALTGYVLGPVPGATWGLTTVLTIGSIPANWGLVVNGPSNPSNSDGILVTAGTNSFDYSVRFRTQAAVDILAARGDGKVVIGGTPANVLLTGTGTAKLVGGTTGTTIRNNADSADNIITDDSGNVTLRNALTIPTAAGGTPAATSFGTVPVKFAETLLGAAAATVTFSSIPATFRHLKSDSYLRGDLAAVNINPGFRLNNDSTANYDELQHYNSSATTLAAFESLGTTVMDMGPAPAGTATANYFGTYEIAIKHYAGTTGNKTATSNHGAAYANTTANQLHRTVMNKWRTTGTAVNRIDYLPISGGNFVAGSFFSVQLEP